MGGAIGSEFGSRRLPAPWLRRGLALVLLIGSDEGIEDEAVERVVDLGDPRQGGGITVGGKHLTELGDHLGRVGQAHR